MSTREQQLPRQAVTRREAATMYGVSTATLRRAEAEGTLRAKLLGGRRLYRVADLETWFSQLEDA